VREFQQGEPPEVIRSHYPTLSLEQVYGAITFYLGHKSEVENDIAERAREEDAYSAAHPTPPDIREKFERMRQQALARPS
jgi:lauroyl/myristoyl acyltransferase